MKPRQPWRAATALQDNGANSGRAI